MIYATVVDEFDRVCKRRKVEVNVGKSKVMAFERVEDEVINFTKQYKIWLEEKKMEEVSEFKYLGTV